jgi:hypothetical protein
MPGWTRSGSERGCPSNSGSHPAPPSRLHVVDQPGRTDRTGRNSLISAAVTGKAGAGEEASETV